MNKWDRRFIELAQHIATWSKDPSTKVGAVITRPDNTICSMGFNGFAQIMPDKPELYADRESKYSRTLHAEVNAVLFARERVNGYTCYFSCGAPCDRCCVTLLQAGISRFVWPTMTEDYLSRWNESVLRTKQYLDECGIIWEEVNI
jgi:dCMP deaminase